MPWYKEDAHQKKKGMSDAQASMWVRVANKSLRSGDDEGTAVKKANGAVKKAV